MKCLYTVYFCAIYLIMITCVRGILQLFYLFFAPNWKSANLVLKTTQQSSTRPCIINLPVIHAVEKSDLWIAKKKHCLGSVSPYGSFIIIIIFRNMSFVRGRKKKFFFVYIYLIWSNIPGAAKMRRDAAAVLRQQQHPYSRP